MPLLTKEGGRIPGVEVKFVDPPKPQPVKPAKPVEKEKAEQPKPVEKPAEKPQPTESLKPTCNVVTTPALKLTHSASTRKR